MKKFGIFLLTLVAIFGFSIQPVLAAECNDDDNIYLNVFKKQEEGLNSALSSKETGTDVVRDNIAQFNSRNTLATVTSLSNFLVGSLGNCVTANNSVEDFYAHMKEASPGVVQQITPVLTNAFFWSPSQNIPGHYANLLLPKEFAPGGGTLLAQRSVNCADASIGLTRPPTCKGATSYWTSLGISNMWSASFSIAMLLVVVILIISGFMIMFRSKLGGQVVVTVSMALQSIIIASVMALASFALGAFFVNLSKALTLLFAQLILNMVWIDMNESLLGLIDIDMGPVYGYLFGTTFLSDPIGLTAKLLLVLLLGDATSIAGEFQGIWSFGVDVGTALNPFIGLAVALGGSYVRGIVAAALSPLYLIIRLVMFGAILFVSIKIVWIVIKTYIKMAIDVVIAPVLFVVSALPGRSGAISEWIKRMFKNALIPPLMFVVVNLAVFVTIKLALNTDNSLDPFGMISGGAIPAGSTFGLGAWLIGPHSIVFIVILNFAPAVPLAVEDMFSGKNSGGMEKAAGEMMKSLQKIPVAGSLFS